MISQYDLDTSLKILRDLAPAGFAIALHVEYAVPSFLLQTYSKQWQDLYGTSGFAVKDPVVEWTTKHTGIVRWSDIQDLDTHGVFNRAADHGMAFGGACGVESLGTRTLAGFARSDREPTAGELGEFEHQITKMHEASSVKTLSSSTIRNELRKLSLLLN